MYAADSDALDRFFSEADGAWLAGLRKFSDTSDPRQKSRWFPVRGTPRSISPTYDVDECYEFAERVVDGRYEVGPVTVHTSSSERGAGRRSVLYGAALKEMLYRARRASPAGEMTVRFVGEPGSRHESDAFGPGMPRPLRDVAKGLLGGRDPGAGDTLPDAVGRELFLALSSSATSMTDRLVTVESVDPLQVALASHAGWTGDEAFRYLLGNTAYPGRVLGRFKKGVPLPLLSPEPTEQETLPDFEGYDSLVTAALIEEFIDVVNPLHRKDGRVPRFEWSDRFTAVVKAPMPVFLDTLKVGVAGRRGVKQSDTLMLFPDTPFRVVFVPIVDGDLAQAILHVVRANGRAATLPTIVFVPGEFLGWLPEGVSLDDVVSVGIARGVRIMGAQRPRIEADVLRGKIRQHPL